MLQPLLDAGSCSAFNSRICYIMFVVRARDGVMSSQAATVCCSRCRMPGSCSAASVNSHDVIVSSDSKPSYVSRFWYCNAS
jgi:hypothetical protein